MRMSVGHGEIVVNDRRDCYKQLAFTCEAGPYLRHRVTLLEGVWRSGSSLELSVAVWLICCRCGQVSGDRCPLRSDNIFLIPPPGATELLPMPTRIAQLSAANVPLLAILSRR